ncbi:FG-GAP and VCBS repeat-containing protein [Streptomyces griseoaurantiacus]|uniref:FG-GAP and VCBS repeat-containing protein n=1 Tax=Streptomyces griseoaurantiacus TaxID=68213 RepID=UPI00346086EE
MRHTRALLLAAPLVAGLLSPLTLTAPASAAPAAHGDDFDGDGYRDYATPSYDSLGGGVRVTFGTATGPGTRTQYIDQSSSGVPGADEADDMFGEVRAAADLDGDGYGDLVVAARGEDVSGREDQGAVTVLWGGAKGLKGGTTIPGKAPKQSYGYMGDDLATGDFDGDGKQDLALVNAGKTYVYRGPLTRSGTTGSVTTLDKTGFDSSHLIAGKVDRDAKTDLVIVGAAFSGTRETADAWFVKGGKTLTPGPSLQVNSGTEGGGDGVIADFDKDGYGDIAVGTPGWSGYKGRVTLWYGSSSGPSTSARITQSTSDVAGTPEPDDSFGASVSAGDVDGDGYQDLAVGVYGEAIGDVAYAGGVHLLRGGSSGVTGKKSQWFARNTAGVPGAVEGDDSFGATVRLRDTDRDGHADLWVHGMYGGLRLPGATSGLTTTGIAEVGSDLVEGFLQ